jgi:hypothetical protein
LALAEREDQADLPDGINLPEEIKRREDRLKAMADAKAKIEARAAARYAQEKAQYDDKMKARAAREQESGRKPRGKPPKAPESGPKSTDQINLTDDESRIMPVSGGGFEQAYNAQAAVDASTMLVVATGVTQAPNDKKEVEPMLVTLESQSAALGNITQLIADTGFFSQGNIHACESRQIEPLIAVGKEAHHQGWRERHSEPIALPENATPMQIMAHRLKTKAGRESYALRKQTVEPVFGIIKSVMRFRQFSLRGFEKVTKEWSLVCLAWNMKRMAVLRQNCAGMG